MGFAGVVGALTSFYATMAQVCFTLLGLWWIVVQFKYQDWMRNRRRRQMAYDTSLYFVLPGIMSLVSLLAPDGKVLWRVTFSSAAVLGAFEAGFLAFTAARHDRYSKVVRWSHYVATALYVLVALVAFSPSLVHSLGVDAAALQVEGVFLALLVFLGVNMTWVQFAQISDESSRFTA
jgi:hypothetical protein